MALISAVENDAFPALPHAPSPSPSPSLCTHASMSIRGNPCSMEVIMWSLQTDRRTVGRVREASAQAH